MTERQSIDFLREMSLFRGLTDHELAQIVSICKEHSHEAGELCGHEEENEEYLRIVKKGEVAIEFQIPHVARGRTITVDTLKAGNTFSWSALGSVTLTASVRAIKPTEVLDVNAVKLMRLCELDTHMGYIIMKNLATAISCRLTKFQLRHVGAFGAVIGEGR